MEASVAPEKHPADQQQEHEVPWPASAPADSVSTQEVLTATKTDGVRRTESKLRQDEEELRRIIDLIPQTILVLNPDGKAIYANLVALDYTGMSLDEVRAHDFRQRVFHPEDVQRLREERRKALAGTAPFENEQRARGKDGKYRWFLIRYNPLLDESGKVTRWYATGTDIEGRKRSENKLRQEERELRQLIDFLPQHVLVLDENGTLLQVNKTMLDYKGLTLEEMKGGGTRERISRDVHPDDLERVQNERSAGLSRGMLFESEKRLLGKDGQFRWFLFRYNPVLNEAGDIVRWFATATDIDDRKQAEDRVRNEAVALREDIVNSSMFEEIVGSSKAMLNLQAQISRVAPTASTVLIQGETGTGKELIARAIHNNSSRSKEGHRVFPTSNRQRSRLCSGLRRSRRLLLCAWRRIHVRAPKRQFSQGESGSDEGAGA
jgi:formate hydrogenlyase transcriptional activator